MVRSGFIGAWSATLMVGLLAGCGKPAQVREVESQLTAEEQKANDEAKAAQEAVRAHPDDVEAERRLVKAYLAARRFPEAFDTVQKLREQEPNSAGDLALLGHACFGLGLFDQAASSFNQAVKLKPDDTESAWWLNYILVARGNSDMARGQLEELVSHGAGPAFFHLLLDAAGSPAEQLTLVEQYGAKMPDQEKIGRLKQALEAEVQSGGQQFLAGRGEVVKAHLSDTYAVSVTIDGVTAKMQLDTGASGILISNFFANRIGATPHETDLVRGFGDTGLGQAQVVTLKKVELGNLALGNVPARIMQDLDVNIAGPGFDGLIGPDFLTGYSYRLDRKNEVLEMYPPGMELPAAPADATTQRYYAFGHEIVTDAGVHSRIDNKSYAVKMVVDTGAQLTLYNRYYADLLKFGKLNSTSSVTAKGVTGYTQLTEVSQSDVLFGGANFAFDRFLATGMGGRGRFIPYGYIGRDILTRFLITVDTAKHMISLALYKV